MNPAIVWALIMLAGVAIVLGVLHLVWTNPTFENPPTQQLATSRYVASLLVCAGCGAMVWLAAFNGLLP